MIFKEGKQKLITGFLDFQVVSSNRVCNLVAAHVLDSNGARIAQGSVTMLTWKEGDPFLVDAENRRPNTCSASVEFKVQSDRNIASQRRIPMPVTVLTGQSQRGNPQL